MQTDSPAETPMPPIAPPARFSTGSRTRAVLILQLLADEPQRFNRCGGKIQGLSQKVLSQTLKTLERDGFRHPHGFPTVPVTVEYCPHGPSGPRSRKPSPPCPVGAEAHIKDVEAARAAFDHRRATSAWRSASQTESHAHRRALTVRNVSEIVGRITSIS